jgi:hypothetical protein
MYYPMLRTFWDQFFLGDFRKHGKSIFVAHSEKIRNLVPADRLLEYNVGSGWEPLCAFLGCEVPKDKPFPNCNAIGGFRQRCKSRMRAQAMNVLLRWLLWAWVMAVAIVLMRKAALISSL